MSILEEPRATWDKRYKQRHYSYRDFYSASVTVTPQTYVFGAAARAVSKWNWPHAGDYVGAAQCYAREVKVLCTEDTYIIFTSINPLYLTLLNQGYTQSQIAGGAAPQGVVPQYITEVPMLIPANEEITFFPTYAVSATWYRVSADGAIYLWIEGNAEGGE